MEGIVTARDQAMTLVDPLEAGIAQMFVEMGFGDREVTREDLVQLKEDATRLLVEQRGMLLRTLIWRSLGFDY